MLLVVDIGNTNITFGIYDDKELVSSYRLMTYTKRTSDEYGFMITHFLQTAGVAPQDIVDVIVSSVVPKIMHSFTNSIRRYLNLEPIIVGPGMKTGIKVKHNDPKAIGADLIVDAVGAHYTYGGDILIIDFGTATTFQYIDSEATYHGGCIMPGIEISSQALSGNTAKLPEIEIKPTDTVISTNTVTAMQAGVFWGYVGAVENMIERFKKELDIPLKVIATGGLGRIISKNTKSIDIYNPHLTFTGLRIVYERNV